MTQATAALEGIRIIDFSHVFQGPVCTQLLADFGADVIKVERPDGGDWSRRRGPFIADVSMPFVNLNRNKRGLAINLKDARGREILLELVRTADVLVHSFRPGTMERLGLEASLGIERAASGPQEAAGSLVCMKKGDTLERVGAFLASRRKKT